MTPAETEHFAALRMHVAHLHAALKNLVGVAVFDAEGDASRAEWDEVYNRAGFALEESEASVRDLLKDANRDLALLAARADLEGSAHALSQLRASYEALVTRSQAVVHQIEAGEASEGDVRDLAWCAAQLREVVPA